ncbi:MAG: cytotoxin [Defluviitaleaceae bacterium]|nr:cytotoxin [Defluviitaleaceae bacterium]
MFRLIPDKHFFRSYKKLPLSLQVQIDNKLIRLAKDPSHPSLRTKRIQGTQRLYESSVNMDVRLIWHYEEGQLIVLLDVGHHDILNQY